MRISKRSSAFPGSAIRGINEEVVKLEQSGVKVYGFHIGQPGLPPSRELLLEFTKELLEKPFEYSMYTPSSGIEELREVIAEDYSRYSGIKVNNGNVSVSAGSAEAILATFMSIIDEGDEVVLFDPTYLMYEPVINYLGGRVRKVMAKEELGWEPNEEDVKAIMSNRVKAIIVVNPDNPTGRVLREPMIKLLIDLARDHDAFLIYDEAYRHLYYEGGHTYAIKYGLENVIALNTFSKDPAMPGWRLGYVVSHEDFIKVFNRVKQYTNLNPPTPAQYAGLLYLKKYKEKYLSETVPIYKSRMEAMYKAIREYLPEARVIKPKAGLFMFLNLEPHLRRLGIDDRDLSMRLVREAHVAVVPGSAFGDMGRLHVRMAFARENERDIEEGIRLIANYLARCPGH
ncbi:pyridoxal phosphate-dependent aminotransferase [Vulcanisaeta souniana]|uniref:Aspartate aminotransferase n=1 Tax=Vulcanisaeta souniana JCM 11219 TaxID=1293586 RepID=A0A830E5V5_9CREN|nr:pyridoxal phosphate-dependent aminotransferase [Vulcanisaeta souniana]BDR92879.1 aspartate aminotransferase [Vulcanisaeta souniana JCM 11219]GGI85354.1 aspartate aminotransferase [Vulcanisaeta souniana JCM 11219]